MLAEELRSAKQLLLVSIFSYDAAVWRCLHQVKLYLRELPHLPTLQRRDKRAHYSRALFRLPQGGRRAQRLEQPALPVLFYRERRVLRLFLHIRVGNELRGHALGPAPDHNRR